MVEAELAIQKRKLNERDGRSSKRRKLNVEARVLTSAEGKRLAAEKDAERAKKVQKKADGAQRRREKENCRDQNRRNWDPTTIFTGILSAKAKGDLMDIAWSLRLAEDGTKAVLLDRINSYFDSHPAARESSTYRGLFSRGGRRAAAAPAAEDPPSQPSTSAIPFHPNTYTNQPHFTYPFTFTPATPLFPHPFVAPPNPPLQAFDAPFNTYSDLENYQMYLQST
ncbi:hypothetical protein B0H15DRAFT_782325 [Mycena belliarum]|uniref:SAP domain-containing protein n=1 Tax=Mycena belliarum TaxID=1033014 RepID=A0AAD6XQY9_9AGAR|nr:hypothetical protein B0H15DRAFT_782325 [Mycena belliae]